MATLKKTTKRKIIAPKEALKISKKSRILTSEGWRRRHQIKKDKN